MIVSDEQIAQSMVGRQIEVGDCVWIYPKNQVDYDDIIAGVVGAIEPEKMWISRVIGDPTESSSFTCLRSRVSLRWIKEQS